MQPGVIFHRCRDDHHGMPVILIKVYTVCRNFLVAVLPRPVGVTTSIFSQHILCIIWHERTFGWVEQESCLVDAIFQVFELDVFVFQDPFVQDGVHGHARHIINDVAYSSVVLGAP